MTILRGPTSVGTTAGLDFIPCGRWCARSLSLVVSGVLAAVAIAAAASAPARSRDLSAIDFSLRLPAALSKFSPYSDVAGLGGAFAGSQYQSSSNPAATDWQPSLPYTVGVSAQYEPIEFESGPTVHVAAQSLTLKLPEWGSLQPAAAEVRSVGSTAGAFTLFNGNYGQLQWGYRFADRFAAGVNVNYTSLSTNSGLSGATLATNGARTVDVRVGTLAQPAEHLLVGLVADYGITPSTTNFVDPTCGCSSETDDVTRQVLARIGATYEYAEKSSIYIDYQYGNFWNSTGNFSVNRIYSGVEQKVFTWLYARAGVAIDMGVGVSPTAGIGIYPTANMSIDFGFQDNMFRELAPEYGSSKLFGISLGMTF